MIGRAKRFLQARRTVPADGEETVGELGRMFALHPQKPFAYRVGDGLGHVLSGKPGQLPGEFVGVFIFNVQTHTW